MKRTIGLIIVAIAQLLKISGVPIPDDIENIVTGVIEAVGTLIGFWGIVHATLRKVIASKKA